MKVKTEMPTWASVDYVFKPWIPTEFYKIMQAQKVRDLKGENKLKVQSEFDKILDS